nr:hypothetical protein [uncultured Mucilaginibacter sp.]
MLARIRQDKAEDKKAGVYEELIESVNKITVATLMKSYLFTKKGVMFKTEKVLPHVTQALEPNRAIFFSFADLKKYQKPRRTIRVIAFQFHSHLQLNKLLFPPARLSPAIS